MEAVFLVTRPQHLSSKDTLRACILGKDAQNSGQSFGQCGLSASPLSTALYLGHLPSPSKLLFVIQQLEFSSLAFPLAPVATQFLALNNILTLLNPSEVFFALLVFGKMSLASFATACL